MPVLKDRHRPDKSVSLVDSDRLPGTQRPHEISVASHNVLFSLLTRVEPILQGWKRDSVVDANAVVIDNLVQPSIRPIAWVDRRWLRKDHPCTDRPARTAQRMPPRWNA